ncbi:MAG: class I SAM-dependent methyltransferase [Hyphomicrobiales bacterium]|nr:class I SAM-dependent methyltransferase [Hyphomicrobiales bacterium]
MGAQPVSSHFVGAPDQPVVEHPLSLAVCPSCGTVQLARPFPFQDLVPPYDWITYREPEDHLDAVVDTLMDLSGLEAGGIAAGLSFKDVTTLDRLAARGFSRTWSIDPREDLGAEQLNANIESVAGLLTPDKAVEVAARRGPVDLLVARHILEHAEAPLRVMEALGEMLRPGGILVIEVPDCRANLERQDYTMIWEEHTLYFTPETLPNVLAAAGCISVGLEVHPFAFEDVIVLYARKESSRRAAGGEATQAAIERNVALARDYGAAFPLWSERYRAVLDGLCEDGRPLAAYGAGHLTCAFLNFHDLADRFAFVVDDTAQKQGLYLPKCGLPIVPNARLTPDAVSACLFGLSPDIEPKVIAKNPRFAGDGGRFYSCFADSGRSIRRLLKS